jgi:hypothetical protein
MSLKDGVSVVKDFFTLTKDVFVGVLVGALLLWPSGLNNKLKEAGFTKGDFGPLTWQAAATAQNVSQAKQDVQDVTGAMENVTADPKYAKDPRLMQVLDKLKTSEVNITSADSTLKTAVAQQQGSAVQQQTSKGPASSGWIMMGRVDEKRQKWVTANVNVPPGSSYALGPGQELQLAETVYLRSESVAGQRAAGAITNVVQSGTKVKVLQVDDQSHALAGGWFVWAQVSVERTS